jgi:hypothetical protein
MIAHTEQPVHASMSFTSMGEYPFALNRPLANARMSAGHTGTQSPHPLQRSSSMTTIPLAMFASGLRGQALRVLRALRMIAPEAHA